MSAEIGTVAAWLLAGVFAWAGAAKARRPLDTAAALRRLGLPAARPLAVAVPGVELGLALVLVVRPAAGGVAALVLLAAFSAVIGRAVRLQLDVGCGCFGSARNGPVSGVELLRNGLLAVLALAALAAPAPVTPDLPALVTATSAAVVGLVVLALVEVRRAGGALLATILLEPVER